MKPNEFIEETEKRLTAFERYWQKMARENPTRFPIELEPVQWEEEFIHWCKEIG